MQDTHVDDYFRGLDPAPRAAFERTRNLVTEVVPEAEQGLSYGIAALKYKGSPLLGFRAAKHHLSVVPFSPEAVDAVRDRLKGFDLSKGTIRFSAATPLPADVVRDLASYRKTEIDERLARRRAAPDASGPPPSYEASLRARLGATRGGSSGCFG